jgi:hypothetical protein
MRHRALPDNIWEQSAYIVAKNQAQERAREQRQAGNREVIDCSTAEEDKAGDKIKPLSPDGNSG